jgi:peptide/nickel transport system ATP-binding protein
MFLLEVDDLHVGADKRRSALGRARRTALLHDISFRMRAGESLALVGRSGSGKTTLARTIAGLVEPDRGQVLVDGVPAVQARRPGGASSVQLLFQNHSASLDPRSTVGDALREGLEASGRDGVASAYADMLSAVGLAEMPLSRRIPQLSGGERQRVALARVMAAEPRLLIADEPTSALDRLTGDGVLDVLQNTCRARGVALVHVTHDLSAARTTAARVLVLDHGTLVDDGTWTDLSRSARHPATRELLSAAGFSRS